MKNYLLILTALVILAIIPLVSAEVNQTYNVFYGIIEDSGDITTTSIPITNFGVLGGVCSDSLCSSFQQNSWNFASIYPQTSSVKLTYPTTLQGANGYGSYFFKENYIPYEIKSNLAGNGTAENFSIFLTQKRNCNINANVNISKINNSTINVTINAQSPFEHSGPLTLVPQSISSIYTSNVTFKTEISGSISTQRVQIENLEFSASKKVSFIISLPDGNYEINSSVISQDSRCLSKQYSSIVSSISINTTSNNGTNGGGSQGNYPINLNIISPENGRTYNSAVIPLNILSANASLILYSLNGRANLTYSGISSINAVLGLNELIVFANNSYGNTKIEKVYFNYIIPPIVDNNPPNYSAIYTNFPANSVYNRTFDYRFWINVTDESGVDKVIIYINDIPHRMIFNGSFYVFNITNLGVGNYDYYVFVNDTRGNSVQTPEGHFTINLAQSVCTISAPSFSVTYPSSVVINASCTNPESPMILRRNGIDVTSENRQSIILPVGIYNYTASVQQSQNYTSASSSKIITIVAPSNGTNYTSPEEPKKGKKSRQIINPASDEMQQNDSSRQYAPSGDYTLDFSKASKARKTNTVQIMLIFLLLLLILLMLIFITLARRKAVRQKGQKIGNKKTPPAH